MNDIDDAKIKAPLLIIDDDAAQLKSLADILTLEDLDPICCQTGQKALRVMRQQQINVAVLDLRLPDMDGLQLLRQLKDENPQLKVIINTGYASLESAMTAVNEEAFAYVRKMGDVEELLAHIHRAFHTHLARHNEILEQEVKQRTKELLKVNGHLINETIQRQEAQTLLFESEERYRRLVELSFDAIIIHSEGKFVYVNEPGLELYCTKNPDELIGRSISDFIHPDDEESVWARIEATKENGVEIPLTEGRLIRADGTAVDVEVAALPITFQGRPAMQVVIRDITRRKQLEEQLRQSQKMEAIGRLAGGIAHDFNNLLTVIIGYTELLLHRLNDQHPLRKHIEEIYHAGERAAVLTRQLLAFSRKQVLQPKVLDLNRIIENMEKMLRPLIGEDIELIKLLADDLGMVKADPGQLEQVIMNLAVNAREVMPQGGTLTMETKNIVLEHKQMREFPGLNPGPYVVLTIRDTGTGMDAEIQSHIFEPFFTTKEQGKGTGLGLATVHGIVKQSEGHISMSSRPGQGTSFSIYLPRTEQITEADEVRQSTGPALPGFETILLVEDEDVVRNLAQRVLLRNGYTVLVANRGAEALQTFQQHDGPIHLLLTDVVMPGGMNGRQLAERLLAKHPELKVLYMSGYTDDIVVRHGVLDSDMAFLEKPFSASRLARKVRQILSLPN
jgi:PAS domain S-box-containing protein